MSAPSYPNCHMFLGGVWGKWPLFPWSLPKSLRVLEAALVPPVCDWICQHLATRTATAFCVVCGERKELPLSPCSLPKSLMVLEAALVPPVCDGICQHPATRNCHSFLGGVGEGKKLPLSLWSLPKSLIAIIPMVLDKFIKGVGGCPCAACL